MDKNKKIIEDCGGIYLGEGRLIHNMVYFNSFDGFTYTLLESEITKEKVLEKLNQKR